MPLPPPPPQLFMKYVIWCNLETKWNQFGQCFKLKIHSYIILKTFPKVKKKEEEKKGAVLHNVCVAAKPPEMVIARYSPHNCFPYTICFAELLNNKLLQLTDLFHCFCFLWHWFLSFYYCRNKLALVKSETNFYENLQKMQETNIPRMNTTQTDLLGTVGLCPGCNCWAPHG